MRSVDYAQSWHNFNDLHRHLLLMMDFDCPLAFRHKKGEYIFELVEFLFSGGEHFWLVGACGVQIVSRCFTLYFTFLALAILFVGLFMLRGDTFIAFYVSSFDCLLIYIYEFFIDICLYCVLFEINKLFCLLVFSTHAVMHFVQCFRKYTG